MRILVAGDFGPNDGQTDAIRAFCRDLGHAIASHGHTLLNGARSGLDALVAEAASQTLKDSGKEDSDRRIVSYFLAGEKPIHKYGMLIRSQLENWELGSVNFYVPEQVARADVIVLIAGSTGTIRAANWARIAGKPVRQVRCRAPHGIGGGWCVTGVSLEEPTGCSGHARWHQLSWPVSVFASVAGVIVCDPGRLQFNRPPGGVVHLRYGQAEPVPQATEPFAAGPGDRLLQRATGH